MFWFVLRFIIWSLLFFGLIYFKEYSPFYFINELQTDATILATDMWIYYFDIPVKLDGNIVIFEHGLRLLILNQCNGLTPFILYTAAMIAYPTRYSIKTKWFFGGMFLLLTLNMLRIIMITLVVIKYPDSFDWAHNIVGRYIIGITTLLLFYFFTTKVSTCKPYGIILNEKRSCYKMKHNNSK